jgi:DegV family protein with EDD domain
VADVKIFTDSASDLSDELYETHGIGVVPFYVTFDKKTYYKERIDITIAEFFRRLKTDKNFPSTSLPSAVDYEDAFRPWLKEGKDVVCLCISSKFSGSYQSAETAVAALKEEFPDRGIYAIDSLQASGGQGVTLMQLIKMRDAGYSAGQIKSEIERIKETSRVILTVDSLEYLQKGGRIGLVSAFAGALLQIKPIIIQQEGELHPVAKIRGRQKAIDKVIDMTVEAVGAQKDDYDYIALNADCYDEVAPMEKKMKDMGFSFCTPIQDLGITIGSHTGPSIAAVCFIKKWDAK